MTESIAMASSKLQSNSRFAKRPPSSSTASDSSLPVQSSRRDRDRRSGEVKSLPTSVSVKVNSGDNSRKPRTHDLRNETNQNKQLNNQRHQRQEGMVRDKSSGTRPAILRETQTPRELASNKQNEGMIIRNDHQQTGKKKPKRRKGNEKDTSPLADSEKRKEASMTLENLLDDMSKQAIRPMPQVHVRTKSSQPQTHQNKPENKPDENKRRERNATLASSEGSRTIPGRSDRHRDNDHHQSIRSPRSLPDDSPSTNNHCRASIKENVSQKRSSNRPQRNSIRHEPTTLRRPSSDNSTSGHHALVGSPEPEQNTKINTPQVKQLQPEHEFDPSQNGDFVPTKTPYVKIVCQRDPGHTTIKRQFSINDILVSAIWTLPPTPPSLSHPEGQQSYQVTVKDPYDLGRALKMKSSSFRIISAHLEDEI
ncbi:hypothetical protein [Phaffia rhodozyma]|uniref:Uncharacterized protein n=1 Tax=Phaffia rhodozyma TaxID=264483 RepID=A0A0F7SL49_PHARH|nr:hypothetical protein [Phaffia rhodozyma]